MDSSKQIKLGVVLSYFQIAAQMVINLLFTPIMLRILGQSEYGLYSTAVSTISTLSVLSLGFSSSYIKKFSEYTYKKDEKALASLNGLYMIIFLIIGLVALVCGLFLTFNLKMIYGTGLTDYELEKAKILMGLLTFNLAINFPMSVFNSIIGANERFVFQKLVYMIKSVLGPMVQIPVLILGYSSVGMVLTTVTMALIADSFNAVYCFSKLKVRFRFRGWETGLPRQLFNYTFFIAINIVIDQINWNIDKVIIGRYRGTTSVAIYSVGHTIHSCYMSLAQNITNVFTPKVHSIANKFHCVTTACSQEFSKLFTKVGRIQYMVLSLICTGFIFYGQPFIKIWAGEGYDNAYYVCLLLMIPSLVPFIETLGIEIQRSLNLHKFRSYFYLGMAICNLILSIFFCQWWGEIGSALGTSIALIVADGFAMNIYYYKVLKIDVKGFFSEILRMSLGLIPPAIFGILCVFVFNREGIVPLILGVLMYIAIYSISIYTLSMNQYEKCLVTDVLKKVFKKNQKENGVK